MSLTHSWVDTSIDSLCYYGIDITDLGVVHHMIGYFGSGISIWGIAWVWGDSSEVGGPVVDGGDISGANAADGMFHADIRTGTILIYGMGV